MFTGQRRGEFLNFLRAASRPSQVRMRPMTLLGLGVRPSKQLLALAAEEVQRREQFVLLDEQQMAYSLVMRAVDESYRANTKEVIVVSGGPGSGKSVIALSLLGELSRQGRTVLHATGSSAFTQTLRRVAGARAPRVQAMFKYFNQFIDAEQNALDVLICDEAHRIRETSANRYTRAELRRGRPQVCRADRRRARAGVSCSTSTRWSAQVKLAQSTTSRTPPKRLGLETRIVELDATVSAAVAAAPTRSGCCGCSVLLPADPFRGRATTALRSPSAEAPSPMEDRLRSLLEPGVRRADGGGLLLAME